MTNETKIRKNEALVNGVVWTVEMVRDLLTKNNNAVVKGMIRIFDYQTQYEKEAATTSEYNSVGFSGAHAEIMTSYVNAYKKFGFLTEKQMAVARKIMLRYAGQLIRIMKGAQ